MREVLARSFSLRYETRSIPLRAATWGRCQWPAGSLSRRGKGRRGAWVCTAAGPG
jgi:hypothetical protein